MSKKRSGLLALCMFTLAGCSSTATTTSDDGQAVSNGSILSHTQRQLTVAWEPTARGGAAIRQGAYVHVLADPEQPKAVAPAESTAIPAGVNKPEDGEMLSKEDSTESIAEALRSFSAIQKSQGISLYEVARWERYCDNGNGMDETDWLFILKADPANIPKSISDSCAPPEHSYGGYISAWTEFCQMEDPSRASRNIVRDSVKPKSISECPGLL